LLKLTELKNCTLARCIVETNPPDKFTWIEEPLLAGMARPSSLDEFAWLRDHGIQLLISLTESPPRRDWINDSGLFNVHVPVEDMQPPEATQIELVLSNITRAHAKKMGVGIHCEAGAGRTGTMLACYFVSKGMTARDAITRIRKLRPGSVETEEQADAVREFARSLSQK